MTTTTTPTNTLTSNDVVQKHKDTPITAKPLNRDQGDPHYRMRLEGGMTQKKDPKDLASAAPPTRFVEVAVEGFTDVLGAKGRPSPSSRPTLDLTHLDVGNGAPKNERMTYAALSAYINHALGHENLVCKDVSTWPALDTTTSGSRRVDLSCFLIRLEEMWKDPELEVSADREEHAARNCVVHSVIDGEVKVDEPGFGCTETDPFLPSTAAAVKTRGQMCDYATEVQLHQHRLFFYSFYVYRHTARLLLWDRVGAMVTKIIDLKTEPEKFYDFFYHLRYARDAQLGFDTTATMLKDPTKDRDVAALTTAINALPSERRTKSYVEKAFEGKKPYYRLQVPDKSDPEKTHTFLVRNLSTNSVSPTGRATKGFIAFDLETKQFRFLKDSWRPDSSSYHTEIEIYNVLQPHSIPGVATLLCGGDLKQDGQVQKTRTQEVATAYLARIHTRLVLNEVGIPLQDYQDSNELCTAILYALRAHELVWNLEILHRDISDGNIVIFENPVTGAISGLLIDWDLCKYKKDLGNGKPIQTDRSGTWRFLSATLLNYPMKGNEVADDIESFYHVLMLFAMRYHKHKKSPDELKGTLLMLDTCTNINGFSVGSSDKLEFMRDGTMFCKLDDSNGAFAVLLRSLADICKEHYAALDKDDLTKYSLKTTPQTLSNTSDAPRLARDLTAFKDLFEDEGDDLEFEPKSQPVIAAAAPNRTLDTHTAFRKALLGALLAQEKWDFQDKLPNDQFKAIDWIPGKTKTTGGTKRSQAMSLLGARPSAAKKRKTFAGQSASGDAQTAPTTRSKTAAARMAAAQPVAGPSTAEAPVASTSGSQRSGSTGGGSTRGRGSKGGRSTGSASSASGKRKSRR
ncbi:hypothetical protein EUX98_g6862 [Antrodiella citrinella]|uniref:Fungal-type protein kinase domain-containing protein n=1 Tax=Antrodiella citrinella TaxID=2447956 RepID=A0A4S4MN75_9APHY|nr:hypothetical protein EUX98_g6862 [Antrodiella citrinella]